MKYRFSAVGKQEEEAIVAYFKPLHYLKPAPSRFLECRLPIQN